MPCSFCSSRFHNISICNHPLIRIYYENIKQIYMNVMALHNSMTYNENMFRSILNNTFYVKDLRAIGVRYFNVYASTSKANLISLLWHYLNTIDWNVEMQHQQQHQQQLQQLQQQMQEQEQDSPDLLPDEPDLTSYIDNNYHTYMTGLAPPPLNVNITQNIGFGNLHNINPHNLAFDFASVAPQTKKYRIILTLNDTEDDKSDINSTDCSICYENIKHNNLVKLNCNHEFCAPCIKNTIIHHTKIYNPSCALCREMMLHFTVKNKETYDLISENCL